MMQRVDNPEQDISTTWRKFSEVWAVASRNSLYRILAISVALGARQRAKSSSQAPLYVLGWGGEGGDCYCELPRIPLPRRSCIKDRSLKTTVLRVRVWKSSPKKGTKLRPTPLAPSR